MNRSLLPILLLLISSIPLHGATDLNEKAAVQTKENQLIQIGLFENLDSAKPFDLSKAHRTLTYTEPAFGFVAIPKKYSRNALPLDRSTPFALNATHKKTLVPGRYQIRLRSKGSAQLTITEGQQTITLQTKPQRPNRSSHDALPPEPYRDPMLPDLMPASVPHQEIELQFYAEGQPIQFELKAIIGGKGLVPNPVELSVSIAAIGDMPHLLSSSIQIPLSAPAWQRYRSERLRDHEQRDDERRQLASKEVTLAWNRYHESIRQWAEEALPAQPIPYPDSATTEGNPIDAFIQAKLNDQNHSPQAAISDLEFLRRLALDLSGRLPTELEIETYLKATEAKRRSQAIDSYLALPDWADHWVSYWQDVLAENPGILKPDLNNSGPFRWWLQQSFEDNIPMDRFAAELIQMQGSRHQGAPAAFGIATLNDAPMAAKADILLQAFQAEKLSCARCHDAPEHRHKQRDTFSLAAMLQGKPLALPESSTVPIVEGFRKPRVEVSLDAGQTIHPEWPFVELSPRHYIMDLIPLETKVPQSRNDLARHIVSPSNRRFAEVLVNRVWKRYLGAGMVEPAEDWEYEKPSHPELLQFLAREFTLSGYNLKQLAKLIVSSKAYQSRTTTDDLRLATSAKRHFAGPNGKRMSAEQLVDSLFLLVGKPVATEELNLNPLGDRPLSQFLNLGTPKRSWEFAALMNERDRPSLALPSAQAVVDVLTAFGWRQSRMNPLTDREDAASPLQTLILANGVLGSQITRLTDDNEFTEIAISARNVTELIERTTKRILTRSASLKEQQLAAMFLKAHFDDRVIAGATSKDPRPEGGALVWRL